jgi:hypothetical protein
MAVPDGVQQANRPEHLTQSAEIARMPSRRLRVELGELFHSVSEASVFEMVKAQRANPMGMPQAFEEQELLDDSTAAGGIGIRIDAFEDLVLP